MSGTRILAIVPARSGSKGVAKKNTRSLAGKSLIERTFDVACSAGVLDRIVLSSDDGEAIDIAQKIGLEVPFVRPDRLAEDRTPMIDVVCHTLDMLDPLGTRYDAVMVLQPTSPLRRKEHIQESVRLLDYLSASAVCSVTPIPLDRCPHYLLKLDNAGMLVPFMPNGFSYTRRQDVPRAYHRCGTLFLTRVETIRLEKNFYGNRCVPLLTHPGESINIDTKADWDEAEVRLEIQSEELRSVV